jgi:NADH:ubiquinone oxidoreductase subunit C
MKNTEFNKKAIAESYLANIIPIETINSDSFGDLFLSLKKSDSHPVLFFLKNHVLCQYSILTDMTGVFNSNQNNDPYDVVYEILSLRYNNRLRIKIKAENNSVFTISDIYISANWSECELWDMYGIYSENHERLIRLLTDYGFEGHPLRKDFPLAGYYDLKYNESKKRVTIDKLELGQEYRIFDYKMSSNYQLLTKS